MNSEARLISEIWETVRDLIPVPKRAEIAQQHLRAFEEYGFEIEEMADLIGEDKYLEEAYKTLYEEDIEDAVDTYDEDGYEGDD
jgi:hypothetical protein